MKYKFFLCAVFLFLFLIFKPWFVNEEIIGGDWPHYYQETISDFPIILPSWVPILGNGMGGQSVSYALDSYLYLLSNLVSNTLHISWTFVYKVFYFYVVIIVSCIGSWKLSSHLFIGNKQKHYKLIASLIYSTNTYFLMLIAGGQMGVALSYALSPLILYQSIRILQNLQITKHLLLKDLLWLIIYIFFSVLFDLRITMIILLGHIFLMFYYKKEITTQLKTIIISVIFVLIMTVLLHLFWIFPLLFYINESPALNVIKTHSVGLFEFFSFARFYNSLALLHPNWPENIFGKIYFMRPQFLLLPILAFSSLLFINKQDFQKNVNRLVLFFLTTLLIGAFLSKGSTEPFGFINNWLFTNMPGFNFFRDPTKFYLLVSLSYSMLLPYVLYLMSGRLQTFFLRTSSIKWVDVSIVISVIFITYWSLLLAPALSGRLPGTFHNKVIPSDYIKLKDYLRSEPEFYRTLWLPQQHRYAYFSYQHPAIEGYPQFKATNSAELILSLKDTSLEKKLSEWSVKYVIVPYDVTNEIFIKNGEYNEEEYNSFVSEISKITWLRPINDFGKVKVFVTERNNPKIWLSSGNVSFESDSPVSFRFTADTTSSEYLFFSESYNENWVVSTSDKKIQSEKTESGINMFRLPPGISAGKLEFHQDVYYKVGRYISLSGFVILGGLLIFVYGIKHQRSS